MCMYVYVFVRVSVVELNKRCFLWVYVKKAASQSFEFDEVVIFSSFGVTSSE